MYRYDARFALDKSVVEWTDKLALQHAATAEQMETEKQRFESVSKAHDTFIRDTDNETAAVVEEHTKCTVV